MNPKFAAWLITMAINEGMEIAEFTSELRANVSEATWNQIEADLRATNKAWESGSR